jgi:hypothetical protein
LHRVEQHGEEPRREAGEILRHSILANRSHMRVSGASEKRPVGKRLKASWVAIGPGNRPVRCGAEC